MAVEIYKITRQGPTSLRFQGKDGTDFTDPNGLRNPQLAKIIGNKLMLYVRCDIGNGMAEVLGEASPEEIADYISPSETPQPTHTDEPHNPYRLFPKR